MTVAARVQVLNEVKKTYGSKWALCLQWCRYIYSNGELEEGYRFIWRRDDGTLQGARGQARIPLLVYAQELMDEARRNGWGHLIGTNDGGIATE